MTNNVEGEPIGKSWEYKDIPKAVRTGSDPEREDEYFERLANGSNTITDEALEQLLNNKK